MSRYFLIILFSILVTLWSFITLRVELCPILLVVIFALSFIKKCNKYIFISIFLVGFLYPLSPIGITYTNAEGFPKIIGYCNIRVPAHDKKIREHGYRLQREGKCIMRSDIYSGFEAKSFIVW